MTELGTMNYDNLIVGEDAVTQEIVIGASQTIKRGDLLERSVAADGTTAANYVKAPDVANSRSFYAVASEDVTTAAGETAGTIGYKSGPFNALVMRLGGTSTYAGNKDILADKGIFLYEAQSN